MRVVCGLATLALIACDDPNLNEYVPRFGIITGEILYRGAAPPVMPSDGCPDRGADRGNVVVSLFEADRPPDAAVSPVNVVIVPAAALFTGDASDGLFSAPYTIPTVAPGTYEVRAFLDVDGDFSPSLEALSQPSAGDVLGGHFDPATGGLLAVTVGADESVGQVSVQIVEPVPVERPAFVVTSSLTIDAGDANPDVVRLEALALDRNELCLDPSRSGFLVEYVDGQPLDRDGDGLDDLFPQVRLRKLDGPPGTTVLIPAAIDPAPFADVLAVDGRAVSLQIEVRLAEDAVSISGDVRERLAGIPSGRYGIEVVSATGQTWRVPNDVDAVLPGAAPDACPADSACGMDTPAGCACVCPDPESAPSCANRALPSQCQCVEL